MAGDYQVSLQPPRAVTVTLGFRVHAVRIALALAWVGLVSIAIDRVGDPDRAGLLDLPLTATAAAVAVLTILPWRRLLRSRVGDAVLVAWLTAVIGLLGLAPDLDLGAPVPGIHLGAAVLAGMLLPRLAAFFIVGGSAAAYVIASMRADLPLEPGHAFGVVGITSLGFLAAIIAEELETSVRRDSLQLELRRREEGILVHREAELERASSVLRTIAAGSTLTEVVPAILRRVGEAVAAGVGMMLVYRPDEQALELLRPIWFSSQETAPGRDCILPLTEHGIAQRVFNDGIQAVVRGAQGSGGAWGDLVADHGLHELMASRLRIEDRNIGVLIVANRITGQFTDEDARVLESLAGPAAFVLDHISRYQEARETSERMAEVAQLKSNFVSVVSHELRTPLTSIIGALRTALRPEFTHPDPDVESLLQSGARQADRLQELIEDLLVVSRVDNRAIPVRPEPVDIRELIRIAVGEVPGSEQLVSLRIAPVLPNLALDPAHTRRVLVNLIANSVKYGEGSPIEIAVRPDSGQLLLTVADHGPGLPFELRDRAFDAFTQLERKSVNAQGGVGLGLAIARGLVDAMGGTIRYEPTPGGGATFKVLLPMRRQAGEQGRAPAAMTATG